MIIAPMPFKGEIPRLENHLLPANCAQQAIDCVFTGGALAPLKGGQLLRAMANNPVRGIYTEDGLLFYTWAIETLPFRSPIIDDSFGRMYFLQPSVGIFSVATTAQMSVDGVSPSGNVWQVGVPQPTVAPQLSVVDRTSLPDYASVLVSATAWWESGGSSYGQAAVQLTSQTAFKSYTFTPPAQPSATPAGATLAVRLTFQDASNNNTEIMAVTARASSTGSTQALPGGIEASLTENADTTVATIALSWGIAYTSAYTYTNQNTWGEESAPSPPATVSWTYLQDVKVVTTNSAFAGFRPFSKFVIYRTYGASGTYLQASVTGTGTTFTDGARGPAAAGLALQSTDWSPPPTGLQGMCAVGNGWFAAFKGDMLYLSEPFRPYAWPYSMPMLGNIRGICPCQGGLVVTTTMGVSMIVGAFPSAAQELKLSLPQPGISQRSMTGVEGAVLYASNDGLVAVQGNQASLELSHKLFTRESWRAMFGTILADASLRLAYHDGFVVGTSNTQPTGFILRLDEDVGGLSQLDFAVDCTFQLPVTDTLYFSSGANVYQFRGGSPLTFDWWGRDCVTTAETNFGAGYIRCDGPITLTVYADGAQFYQTTLNTGGFRLPSGLESLRWSVRLQGAYKVHEFRIAGTMEELRQMSQPKNGMTPQQTTYA